MEIAQFPHIILINKSGIKLRELSQDVKNSMETFQRRLVGWKMKRSQDSLKFLISDSEILAQHIYDYFVESEDQEAETGNIEEMAQEIIEAKEEENAIVEPVIAPVIEPIVPASQPEEIALPKQQPLSRNEQALESLLAQGITDDITVKMLRDAGLDTSMFGNLGSRGGKWGKYVLSKSLSDATFKLSNSEL